MDKANNKKLTIKTSSKNIINSKKSLKPKEFMLTSARTPRSGNFKIDLKKHPVEKFKNIKSIPTITYREFETTVFPSEINENQENYSYLNQTEGKMESDIQSMKAINIKQLLSDRRVERSSSGEKKKQSILIRGRNEEKTRKKKDNVKKERTKQRRNTTLNIATFQGSQSKCEPKPTLQSVLQRTSKLLFTYKTRQEQWRKQKQQLIKELQKYKRKTNGKSITTTTSSHNSQSQKMLI